MESRAKKKRSNIIMVVLIVIIAACGVLAVGMLKGWLSGGSGGELVSTDIKGIANIERSSVAYTLKKDVALQSGDIIATANESEAAFALGSNQLVLGASAEMEMTDCGESTVCLKLSHGEMYGELPKAPDGFGITFGSSSLTAADAVLSVSAQKGSAEIDVFGGEVIVTTPNDGEIKVKEGNCLLISSGSNGKVTAEKKVLQATTLNDFQIEKLKGGIREICFSEEELDKVISAREAEKKEQAKALEKEAIAYAQGGNDGSASSAGGSTGKINTCTIQIQCKSILNNMDKLKEGKNRYVPSNGVILTTSKVEFKEGDTAYDVTRRACSATGIQIEASYAPVYGSYYVEGINHLYEFDCGKMSGWMYKVNGWAPNYGSSEYKLKNGDSIVWYYTCRGN